MKSTALKEERFCKTTKSVRSVAQKDLNWVYSRFVTLLSVVQGLKSKNHFYLASTPFFDRNARDYNNFWSGMLGKRRE